MKIFKRVVLLFLLASLYFSNTNAKVAKSITVTTHIVFDDDHPNNPIQVPVTVPQPVVTNPPQTVVTNPPQTVVTNPPQVPTTKKQKKIVPKKVSYKKGPKKVTPKKVSPKGKNKVSVKSPKNVSPKTTKKVSPTTKKVSPKSTPNLSKVLKKKKKCTCKQQSKPVCFLGIKFPNNCVAKCFGVTNAISCSGEKKTKVASYHTLPKTHMTCVLKSLNKYFSRKYCTYYVSGKKVKSTWVGKYFKTEQKKNVNQFLSCSKKNIPKGKKFKCCLFAKVCPKNKSGCRFVKLKCLKSKLPKKEKKTVKVTLSGEKHVLRKVTQCKWKTLKLPLEKVHKFEQKYCCSHYELKNLKVVKDSGKSKSECKWVGPKRKKPLRCSTFERNRGLCNALKKWEKKLRNKKNCSVKKIGQDLYRKQCCTWFLMQDKGKVIKKCSWVSKPFHSPLKPTCTEVQVSRFSMRKKCCLPNGPSQVCHFKGPLLKRVVNTKQAACTWILFNENLKKKYCCAWWYQCLGRTCRPVNKRCKFVGRMVKRWNVKETTNFCKVTGFSPHIYTFNREHVNVAPHSTGEWEVLKYGSLISVVARTRPCNKVSVVTAVSIEYKSTKLEIYGKDNLIKVGGYANDIQPGKKSKLVEGFEIERTNLKDVFVKLDNGIRIEVKWYKLKNTRTCGSSLVDVFIFVPNHLLKQLFGLCTNQFRKPLVSPFTEKVTDDYLDKIFLKNKKPFGKALKLAAKVSCLRRQITKPHEFENCVTDILNTQRVSTFAILEYSSQAFDRFKRRTS